VHEQRAAAAALRVANPHNGLRRAMRDSVSVRISATAAGLRAARGRRGERPGVARLASRLRVERGAVQYDAHGLACNHGVRARMKSSTRSFLTAT